MEPGVRVPSYGAVVSLAAMLGVVAFFGVLVVKAPPVGPQQPPPPRVVIPSATDPDRLLGWLRRNPDHPQAAFKWLELGNQRRRMSQRDEALDAWDHSRVLYEERLADAESPLSDDWYNLACCRAQLGDKAGALEALGRAVDAGYGNRRHTREDPDLESLRDDPAFEEVIQRMPRRPNVTAG